MNQVWNLDPIYKGFDDPSFEGDMKKLQEAVSQVETFSRNLSPEHPAETLRRGIALQENCVNLINKLAGYASLRQAADTKNPEAGSCMGRVMALYSGLAAPLAAMQDWASKLPNLMDLVRNDEDLKDYEFLFAKLQESSKYLLPGIGEAVAAKLELSGGNAWADMHQYLTSTVPVTYQGKTTNLSSIRNLAYDPDPRVRKEAYEAELACYDRIKDPIAYALNSLKLESISDCQLRGYDSPLDRTLKGADMKRETLDAMFSAIDEYLPKFWQYLKAKGKALGHENGLPWYDLFAPMGKSSKKFTAESARDYLVNLFAEFDQEESQMIARAFDNAWIDFYPRDGKAGGAFCASAECLGESRILTNFDGMFTDVVTLAHELGHAFHNHNIRSHRPLNMDYSMPVAETASTFNECVVMAEAITTHSLKVEAVSATGME